MAKNGSIVLVNYWIVASGGSPLQLPGVENPSSATIVTINQAIAIL